VTVGGVNNTEYKPNGPCAVRVVLVVIQRGAGDGTNSTWDFVWTQQTNVAALNTVAFIQSGSTVLFDKTYVMRAEGDIVLDRVFIDTDFVSAYLDSTNWPVVNSPELWLYTDDGEFTNITGTGTWRIWWDDE